MKHAFPIISAAAAFALSACATIPTLNDATSTRALADQFFDAVAREDLPTISAMLASPDVKVHAMFNPSGQADDASIRSFPVPAYMIIAFRNYDTIIFSDRAYSVADDGKTIWAEAKGNLTVAATGAPYRNRYVFKLTLANDKITEIKEWVNTTTLLQQGIPARPATP